jgi:hypothetical protein
MSTLSIFNLEKYYYIDLKENMLYDKCIRVLFYFKKERNVNTTSIKYKV